MWLLSIETRKLEYFEGNLVPEYVILSHRWIANEVSFQDVMTGAAESRPGYHKIDKFCNQVSRSDCSVTYVWIDTCCIDKQNSSELSEAINSMYRWYLQAKRCYAYLADVVDGDMDQFAKSAWFTRGWTLQELLAPDHVLFFDQSWNMMGTKLQLSETITQITGIPADALKHFDCRRSPHSVADRMSWAATRHTTRVEDIAYCLLGLFGVNMPLLYGEGSRAFLRLQQEILKISEDLTLFVWSKFPQFPASNDYLRDTSTHDFGVFAASPESFAHGETRLRNLLDTSQINDGNLLEASFSGAGLAINLVLIPYCPDIYISPLCTTTPHADPQEPETGKVGVMFLERTKYKGRFRRVVYNGQSIIFDSPERLNIVMGRTQKVVLERTPYHSMGRSLRDKYGFNILHIEDDILKLFQTNSRDKVDILKRSPTYNSLFMKSGDVGIAGMVRLSRKQLAPIYFHFGFDFDFSPFCLISRPLHRDARTSEDKIVFDSTGKQLFSVDCNFSMLRLVTLLQTQGLKTNLQHHNVELHMGSWKSAEMQFVGRDCRIGLDLSAGHEQGYVYHVCIGLAQKQYPWASNTSTESWEVASRQQFKWHTGPWNQA